MEQKIACVLGGSGFVGTWLVNALVAAGYQVRVPTRHRHRMRRLAVLDTVSVIEADVHDAETLTRLVDGCALAVNLVGILNEHRRGDFEHVHVGLTRQLVAACQARGVPRLLHMSALHADAEKGPSEYLRTKGEAEDLVHGAGGVAVTSFRPSVIFGPDDSFFNRFAGLLKLTPLLFPLACPNARFAPVYVGDVARAFVNSIDNEATFGQRYDLCGPDTFTLKELVAYTARQIGVRRRIMGLGPGLSYLQAMLLERVPGKPMSRDNFRSLQVDSVCAGPPAPELGITPTAMDAVVPGYLGDRNRNTRLDRYRDRAHHG